LHTLSSFRTLLPSVELGLKARKMSKRSVTTVPWTRKEDDALRAAAASGESIAEISKRLSRSEKAIRHRAEKLGVQFTQQRERYGSLRRLVAALKARK
jgi:DNA-binding NarL/FixJ family response regulator